jgi:hypothetical protein
VGTKQGRVHANPHTEPWRRLPPGREALPCTEAGRRDMGAVCHLPDVAFLTEFFRTRLATTVKRSGLS